MNTANHIDTVGGELGRVKDVYDECTTDDRGRGEDDVWREGGMDQDERDDGEKAGTGRGRMKEDGKLTPEQGKEVDLWEECPQKRAVCFFLRLRRFGGTPSATAALDLIQLSILATALSSSDGGYGASRECWKYNNNSVGEVILTVFPEVFESSSWETRILQDRRRAMAAEGVDWTEAHE